MEVKKVKCFPAMSEETECFKAELWDNGVKVADIKNDGHGGCHTFYPAKGFTYADVRQYDTIDNECKIMDLVIEFDEIRKNQTKGFFLKKGDHNYTVKFPRPISRLKGAANYSSWLTNQLDNFRTQGFTVLNKNL